MIEIKLSALAYPRLPAGRGRQAEGRGQGAG